MSALSLRLSKSLHEQLREWAQEEGFSVNQFVMLALPKRLRLFRQLHIWKSEQNVEVVQSFLRS